LRYWGEHKSHEQYLSELYAMHSRINETVRVFKKRFQNFYFSIPKEIRPPEATTIVYYLVALHPNVSCYLRKRGSQTLDKMFIDAQEVEDNIWAFGKLLDQNIHANMEII